MPLAANRPTVLNRLCHHVVLRGRENVDAVVDRLLLVLLRIEPELRGATPEAIGEALKGYFSVEMRPTLLSDSVKRLLGSGALFRIAPTANLQLKPEIDTEIGKHIDESIALENAVRAHWVASCPPELQTPETSEELWRALQQFAASALLQHGAETALLLSPELAMPPSLQRSIGILMNEAIRTCATERQGAAEAEIRRFFTAPVGDRARYIAQLMDGAFTFFALAVDEQTARFLKSKLAAVDIFLDTNVIFGILGLNDDEAVHVSTELVDLIQREKFPFRLYYHERTLEEISATVANVQARLARQFWQSALSRAALRSQVFTDIEMRFHELNAATETDPEVFLSQYRHVDRLLRARGFTLFRSQDHRGEQMEQRALLVAQYADYLERHPPRRPKYYSVLNHDASVWLAAKGRRHVGSNVLETGALLLSLDFTLYKFDREELRGAGEPGVVTMPRQLIQILRPFSAPNEKFDQRFAETFSLPEFRTLGAVPASAAAKVLAYLNTYSKIPEDVAVDILSSELFAKQVSRATTDEEIEGVVDRALSDMNRQLIEERERLQREGRAIAEARQGEQRLREVAEAQSRAAEEEARRISDELERSRAQQQETAQQVDQLQRDLAAVLAQHATRTQAEASRRLAVGSIGWSAFGIATAIAFHILLANMVSGEQQDQLWRFTLGSAITCVSAVIALRHRRIWHGALAVLVVGLAIAVEASPVLRALIP